MVNMSFILLSGLIASQVQCLMALFSLFCLVMFSFFPLIYRTLCPISYHFQTLSSLCNFRKNGTCQGFGGGIYIYDKIGVTFLRLIGLVMGCSMIGWGKGDV